MTPSKSHTGRGWPSMTSPTSPMTSLVAHTGWVISLTFLTAHAQCRSINLFITTEMLYHWAIWALGLKGFPHARDSFHMILDDFLHSLHWLNVIINDFHRSPNTVSQPWPNALPLSYIYGSLLCIERHFPFITSSPELCEKYCIVPAVCGRTCLHEHRYFQVCKHEHFQMSLAWDVIHREEWRYRVLLAATTMGSMAPSSQLDLSWGAWHVEKEG